MTTPESVVQRQLDAYNSKDIVEWLNTYAPDAMQYELHGLRLAEGHDEIRQRTEPRFSEPDLHAHLHKRIVAGNVVVDYETVTRNFPEGKGTVNVLCIYEVVEGRISKASFSFGPKQLGN